jgi:hypothetical protein
MAYPSSVVPTSRSVRLGDYPVRSFRAQNGKELRLLYGNRRSGQELELTYENIADGDVVGFMAHYEDMKGTHGSFDVPASNFGGWGANVASPFQEPQNNLYRFADAPQITSVRPGRSTVVVRLVSVIR